MAVWFQEMDTWGGEQGGTPYHVPKLCSKPTEGSKHGVCGELEWVLPCR